MKIYVASSWKNAPFLVPLTRHLREEGYEVDCFCDPSLGRFVFSWDALGISPEVCSNMTAPMMLALPQVQKAYHEDKKWIDWSNVVVMVLPCGKSAHLEAGYAKGAGKKLVIYGKFEPGEWDVMYGFADALVQESFEDLCKALDDLSKEMGSKW